MNHCGSGRGERASLQSEESWKLSRDAGCHCYSAQMQKRVDGVFVDNGRRVQGWRSFICRLSRLGVVCNA